MYCRSCRQASLRVAGITDPEQIAQLKRRNQILAEVVSSERSYCKSLQKVWDFFYLPLKAKQGSMITEADWKSIFSSFGAIANFQRTMLAELEEVYAAFQSDDAPEHFSAVPIANVLSKYAPFLRMYRSYVSNYTSSIATLKRLQCASKDFAKFVNKQSDEAGGDLAFFLIQPVQRVPRYGLLIRELIKYTPGNLQEGLETLKKLRDEIDGHCTFINREATLDDARSKVGEIHNRFRGHDIGAQIMYS